MDPRFTDRRGATVLAFPLLVALCAGCTSTAAMAVPATGGATSRPTATAAEDASTYRVAVVQLASHHVGRFDLMLQLAREAKANGAVLVVLPEASVFGWLNPEVFTAAQPIPGTLSDGFAAIAMKADLWVAAGLAEQAPGTGVRPEIHNAYDAGILVDPEGQIVIHHRKYAVLQNAFDPAACGELFDKEGCAYAQGPLSDVKVVDTPFGRTALLVCADAYTYDPTVLNALKALAPDLVIVPWGVAAATQEECGKENFNATGFAAQAAKVLGTAYVVGANAVGPRPYGRFLPSVYCGTSGYATPSGQVGGQADTTQQLAYFDLPTPPGAMLPVPGAVSTATESQ